MILLLQLEFNYYQDHSLTLYEISVRSVFVKGMYDGPFPRATPECSQIHIKYSPVNTRVLGGFQKLVRTENQQFTDKTNIDSLYVLNRSLQGSGIILILTPFLLLLYFFLLEWCLWL